MKRFYKKPKVAIERFESSLSVAVGCTNIIAVAEIGCANQLTLTNDATACGVVQLGNGRYVSATFDDPINCADTGGCYDAAIDNNYAAS